MSFADNMLNEYYRLLGLGSSRTYRKYLILNSWDEFTKELKAAESDPTTSEEEMKALYAYNEKYARVSAKATKRAERMDKLTDKLGEFMDSYADTMGYDRA